MCISKWVLRDSCPGHSPATYFGGGHLIKNLVLKDNYEHHPNREVGSGIHPYKGVSPGIYPKQTDWKNLRRERDWKNLRQQHFSNWHQHSQ